MSEEKSNLNIFPKAENFQVCKFCKFWQANQKKPDNDPSRQCTRNPPTVFMIQSALGSTGFMSTWPSTKPGDGCGEFSMKSLNDTIKG